MRDARTASCTTQRQGTKAEGTSNVVDNTSYIDEMQNMSKREQEEKEN